MKNENGEKSGCGIIERNIKNLRHEMLVLLCRLPALAEATYRDHFCRLASASASASQKISVTFFSGTTQASFLIFGTEHQYGELYRVTQF